MLIPPATQAQPNDRIAVFGRWIVDDGHDDFHTEIHPPLLVAASRTVSNVTHSTLVARPYLASQNFTVTPGHQDSDGALLQHLVREIRKVLSWPFNGSSRIELHPIIHPKPFQGQQVLQYLLRPPAPPSPQPGPLTLRYSLFARSGVTVELLARDAFTVGVRITLDEAAYPPAPPPTRHDVNIDPANTDLSTIQAALLHGGLSAAAAAELGIPWFGPILGGHALEVLNSGWLTDIYDQPRPSQLAPQSVVVAASDLGQAPVQVVRDGGQPWPLYGYIDLGWGPPPEPDGFPIS
jgi:hypothetical protein